VSERFTAFTEWKSLDSGELEGYAAIFNIPDDESDVIRPGAFRKTLNDRRQSGQPLPLLADHNLSTDGVIGSVTHAAEEDQHGLRVRAKFSGIAKAQDIRARMVEGHIRGMSFTYQTIRSRAGTLAGKAVRYLEELRLFEATVTPFPMHPMALASPEGRPGCGRARARPSTGGTRIVVAQGRAGAGDDQHG
jgi:HK97 family phage prohead protease